MAFPTGTEITTANVASADSDPSLARVDIYNLIVAFNQLIASENGALGVAVLNGAGQLAASRIPGTLAPTGDVTLNPSSGRVNINNLLSLAQLTYTELGTIAGTDAPTAGDVVYLTDGDAGDPCLSIYDGTSWRVVRLAMSAGDDAQTFSTAFTLACEATVV